MPKAIKIVVIDDRTQVYPADEGEARRLGANALSWLVSK